MMHSNEFVDYIKSSEDIIIKNEEKERLNYYINYVKEIERINKELDENIGPPYFKKFMLPEDFIKILRDLRIARIRIFNKLTCEKRKYLKKLELSEEKYIEAYDIFEKELAKKLNLDIYKNRFNKTIIK